MHPSLNKLLKYFRLEAERGFDNKAIVGGLDKILQSWEADARLEKFPEEKIQAVVRCLRNYPNLDQSARSNALKELWQTINAGNVLEFAQKTVHIHKRQPETSHSPLPVKPQNTSPLVAAVEVPLPPLPSRQLRRTVHIQGDLPELGLNAPLTVLPGIGPRNAEVMSALGVNTLGELLYYFPRRYDDYSQLKPIVRLWYGDEVTVVGVVQKSETRHIRGGASTITEVVISDTSGSLRLTWFNQPWLGTRLKPGEMISVSGKVDQYLGRLIMTNPSWEPVDAEQLHTNRIVPIYPLSGNLTQKKIRTIMRTTLDYWVPRIPDYLPESTLESTKLVDLPTALEQIHYPESMESLRAARERLAFDEIFFLQLGVFRQKRAWRSAQAQIFEVSDEWLTQQVDRLPFTLTDCQQRALGEIRLDLASGHPMNRLLQGDVGSGKTVISALAIAMITSADAQAAMMAPTSILAEQHYRSLTRLLCITGDQPDGGVLQSEQVRLLIGDTPESEKETIRQGLTDGSIKVVIGTHAIIEDPIQFKNLEMVVVDEQHRFGVEQRAALRSKGTNPHLLVMTATPIPRSLALTIYGDLDLSVMDELPAGRQDIETHVLFPRERERAYTLIKSQVAQGHQAFIIYPLIEQNGDEGTKAAVEEHHRLEKEVFPHFKLGLLHGRLRQDEKETVMSGFRDNQYQILVSTSVIEVGVDIPNATVMLVEGADRFGLAQLHQFRGRVGRGSSKSYCLLIPQTEESADNQRLTAMAETNDGFILAERDLQQRGPGEFLGTRQSGYSNLKLSTLTNVQLIEKARDQAQDIFASDPDLSLPEHSRLVKSMRHFWGEAKGDIS